MRAASTGGLIGGKMRIQALVVSAVAGIFANVPLVGTEAPQSSFSGYVVDRTWPRPLPNDWKLEPSPEWPRTSSIVSG